VHRIVVVDLVFFVDIIQRVCQGSNQIRFDFAFLSIFRTKGGGTCGAGGWATLKVFVSITREKEEEVIEQAPRGEAPTRSMETNKYRAPEDG